jgi:hypothetical protein
MELMERFDEIAELFRNSTFIKDVVIKEDKENNTITFGYIKVKNGYSTFYCIHKQIPMYTDDPSVIVWHSHPTNKATTNMMGKELLKFKSEFGGFKSEFEGFKKEPRPSLIDDCLAIPDDCDLFKLTINSMNTGIQNVEVIVSDKGICCYCLDDAMMDYLTSLTDDEEDKLFNKSEGCEHSQFFDNIHCRLNEVYSSEDPIETAMNSFKNIMDNNVGFVVKFYPW